MNRVVHSQCDNQRGIHDSLDEDLLLERTALISRQSVQLAVGVPRNGVVKLPIQGQHSSGDEEDRQHNDEGKNQFLPLRRSIGEAAPEDEILASRGDRVTARMR